MPCDSIQISRAKLAGNVDPGLLEKAMLELGISRDQYEHDAARQLVVMRVARGVTAPSQAQITQAYSAQVVKSTARKNGWQLKQLSQFKYEVIRR